MGQIVFVTGTDTGVGKTFMTTLFAAGARQQGINALAMKPFCSGGRRDAEVLLRAVGGQLTLDEINPFYFAKPLAPALASRRTIPMQRVLDAIERVASRCELLFVEGAGGLLVPLGENYFVVDLIRKLACPTLLVSRNRLGTINHTLLSLQVLRAITPPIEIHVLLRDEARPDLSSRCNLAALQRYCRPSQVWPVPFVKGGALAAARHPNKKMKKALAEVLGRI